MPGFNDRLLSAGVDCNIPSREISWRFGTSGGPGGQHANRVRTRVEAEIDLTKATGISDEVRKLLVARLGPKVRVVVERTRSQDRNREIAFRLMQERLSEGCRINPTRQKSRPKRGAIERRLEEKRRRSHRKLERRRRWDED